MSISISSLNVILSPGLIRKGYIFLFLTTAIYLVYTERVFSINKIVQPLLMALKGPNLNTLFASLPDLDR